MKSLSRVRLLETPRTIAYQAPPSMGFSRQEYWSGVPLPSPISPPSGSEIVSHGDFSSIFLMANNVKSIFFIFADHLYIVFGEMYIEPLCPFLNWVTCLFIIKL